MNHVESVYPLSPMQEGMLFHTLHAPESAEYFRQLSFTLHGSVDSSRLRAAWQATIDAQPVLRTAFLWDDVKQPVQAVVSQTELPWHEEDWTHLTEAEQATRLRRFQEDDWRRGFDLRKPPLIRCALIRLAPEKHQLVSAFHHIVIDGWSMPLILAEVSAHYEGRPLTKRNTPGFRDYIAWLSQKDPQKTESFWKEYLRGFTTPTPVGFDRGRQVHAAPAGYGEYRCEVPGSIADRLQALSKEHRITVNSLLQTAWALLLSRYSGVDDVVFGAVVSGRPPELPGVDQIVGMFVNTVPVRVKFQPGDEFLAVSSRLQTQQLEARAFEQTSLSKVQEWSGLPRRQELFDSLFVFENVPNAGASGKWNGWRLEAASTYERTSFPLTLTIVAEAGITILFSYQTARFDSDAIARMAGHFLAALDSVCADRRRMVSDISIVTPAELAEMEKWNATRRDYPLDRCVHEFIEEQAQRTPDAVAVCYENRNVTYRELNRRSNQLAHWLRANGCRAGSLVGITMERSVDMVVALLGAMKSGAAYVPLDPDYPAARLAMMIGDAAPAVILTQQHLKTRIARHETPVLALDSEWPLVSFMPETTCGRTAEAGDLAYVIYTSGSTGNPKGAMNTHRGLTNRLLWMQDEYGLDASDRVLQKTPYSFDVSVWEFFWPLMTGARLVVAEPERHKDPAYLARIIREQAITTLHFVPSMLQAFLLELSAGSLPSLKRTICSGEALTYELQQRYFSLLGAELHNLYGPTEAAIDVTYWKCRRDGRETVVAIGHPIANTQIRILDRNLNLLPRGIPGELHIGGVGVARGYLNRPDLTEEKFIPDPWACAPGEKLYKTGDLARQRPDGSIEYLGRLDHQIKIRGQRIELGEIEAALLRDPSVREAAVLAREDAPGDKRLVAYVVSQPDMTANASRLRESLQSILPEYMLPAAFVFLPQMPISANGKLDRKALPAPGSERPEVENVYVPPRTEAEKALATIWSAVLHLDRVGVEDNFFELGGDSIRSIQVVSKANRAGYKISTRLLFEYPRIADLAKQISMDAAIETDQGPISGPVALTPVEHWWLEANPCAPHHFNQAVLLEPRRRLDPATLEKAFRLLVNHHDGLRLRLQRDGKGWSQQIAPTEVGVVFSYHDVSALPPAGRDVALEETGSRLQASLDLERGPVCKIALFDFGPDAGGRLLLAIHHAAVDAVSWQILLEDLETCYEALASGQAVQFPPKTASIQHWAQELRVYADSDTVRQHSDRWLKVVSAPGARLPRDFGGFDNGDNASEILVTDVLTPEETSSLIYASRRAYKTSPLEVLLAALGSTIGEWTGSRRITVDLEGHGREEVSSALDVSRTVGWFTSVFPVPVETSGGIAGTLTSVKETVRNLPAHGFSYGLLRYLSTDPAIRSALAEAPDREILFNYLAQVESSNGSESWARAATESVGPTRSPRQRRRYLFEINAAIRNGRLQIFWSGSHAAHSRETVEQLVASFTRQLRNILRHCESQTNGQLTPSDFPLVSITQQQLDKICQRSALITDLYPLSLMQEGMLFQKLYEPEPGTYMEQLCCRLEGELDISAFERAWQTLASRHAVLRTAFLWEETEQPIQAVFASSNISIQHLDWTAYDDSEIPGRIQGFLVEERGRGFVLSEAPLMRLALARVARDRFELFWSWSHLLMDGWCLPIVVREFLELYRADCEHRKPAVATPGAYRDYIAWLGRQDQDSAREFWRETLRGFAEPTPLPLARAKTGNTPAAGALANQLELPESTTATLREFARRNGLTMNTLLQGAWGLVLMRCTGTDDVVFGATVAGRPAEIPDVETIVGLFINTLPVRAQAQPAERVVEWLHALQRRQSVIQQYESTPLSAIQQASDIAPGTTLFEHVLVFENYPMDESKLDAGDRLHITGMEIYEQGHYPLHLVAVPAKKLLLRAIYDSTRYSGQTIERLLNYTARVLETMASAPTGLLAEIQIQPEIELRRTITTGTGRASSYPCDRSVVELFEQQVSRNPKAIAVTFQDRNVSYEELDRLANRIANTLLKRGSVAGALIGLAMERSVEMIAGMIGILKAGGAYLPLDPAYPEERLAFMLEDSGCPVVLTQSWLKSRFDCFKRQLIPVDQTFTLVAEDCAPGVVSAPEDLAYAIYTSGSTGKPKGVSVPHRAIVRLVRETDYLPFRSTDVFLQFAPISFDASTFEIWGALLNGARLAVFDPHKPSLEDLGAALRLHGVTAMFLTTGLFHLMIDNHMDDLKGVNHLLAGGDVLSPDRVRRAVEERPGCRFVAVYGPTENTTFSTFCEMPTWNPDWTTVPIGRPIANSTALVLDRNFAPVPQGAPGELYVGGDGLACGYLNNPELTAERFVNTSLGRLYKTGDLARLLPDGNLEFLGRIDTQVKIRGFRIELSEIEIVLNGHPGVRDSAVIARVDRSDEKRLAAFFVPASDGAVPHQTELRRFLQQRLPEYMLPASFTALDRLPLSPSGKVDRRQLLSINDVEAVTGVTADPAALTETQSMLATIWAEVLGLPHVGIDDNFFDLGGDSILTIKIISRAARAGLKVTAKQVFEQQTVRALASVIEASGTSVAHNDAAAGRAPLTPIQRWFFEAGNLEPDHFHQTLLLETREQLDPALLQQALNELVRHHDALSMRFEQNGGGWRQTAAETVQPLTLDLLDISDLPTSDQSARFRQIVASIERGLDLSLGRLTGAALVRFGHGQPDRVVLTAHRLVVDGVSWRILLEDLDTAYEQLHRGQAVELPPRTSTFRRWASHLPTLAATAETESEAAWWRESLAGRAIALPLDFRTGENTVQSSQVVTVNLSVAESKSLQDVAAAFRTQINEVLLAALSSSLRDWLDTNDIRIDLESHGREDFGDAIDVSRTVGWFTFIYPIRLPLVSDAPGHLAALKEKLRAIPRGGLGYGLLRYLNPNPDLGRQMAAVQPAEISFNYLGQFDQTFRAASRFAPAKDEVDPSQPGEASRRYKIEIVASVMRGQFEARFVYSENQFEPDTIERIAQGFASRLRSILDATHLPGPVSTSDFKAAQISPDDLTSLLSRLQKTAGR